MAVAPRTPRILRSMRAWCCAVLAVAACGGNQSGNADGGGDGSIDTPTTPGWTTLIERSWQLPAYYEQHLCRVMKVPADMYITGYHVVAPTGTHHTLVYVTNETTVGDTNCTPTTEPSLLYAGGINTNDLLFPQGVAIKLSADTFIKLELHLFNPSDSAISGTSGLQIKTAMASEVVNEGDMLFLGNRGITPNVWSIPPTNTPTSVYGSCGAPVTWHLFALWPHMHSYATHQKVVIDRSGSPAVDTILDTDYDVREQKFYGPMDMVVNQFDELQVTCTYVNDTNITAPPGITIYPGEGSTDEMCLTGLLKYPKGGTPYQCASL